MNALIFGLMLNQTFLFSLKYLLLLLQIPCPLTSYSQYPLIPPLYWLSNPVIVWYIQIMIHQGGVQELHQHLLAYLGSLCLVN